MLGRAEGGGARRLPDRVRDALHVLQDDQGHALIYRSPLLTRQFLDHLPAPQRGIGRQRWRGEPLSHPVPARLQFGKNPVDAPPMPVTELHHLGLPSRFRHQALAVRVVSAAARGDGCEVLGIEPLPHQIRGERPEPALADTRAQTPHQYPRQLLPDVNLLAACPCVTDPGTRARPHRRSHACRAREREREREQEKPRWHSLSTPTRPNTHMHTYTQGRPAAPPAS